MAKMKILAVKLTRDPSSTKVVYEKNGKQFIRSGEDGFVKGTATQAPLKALSHKWGFRLVENPPEFRDADEIIDNLGKFEVKQDGTVSYAG